MKSTLNDAATTSLMDHMSNIDKQRRLIVMKQKEVETKLALAEQECKALMKQHENMNDEEMKLKSSLEKLLEEQQQLQLRVMTDANRVRRAEEEEPLLTKHVEEQLDSILAELPRCRQKVEQVNELHESWLVSQKRNLLEAKWKECNSEYSTLSKEKELLQQYVSKQRDKLTELQNRRHELLVQGQDKQRCLLRNSVSTNNSNNCIKCINVKEPTTESTNNIGSQEREEQSIINSTLIGETDDAEKSEREQVQVEIQECEYQLEQTNAQNARQIGMIQREVNDLTCRAQELGQWLHDMEITKQQLTLCANNFDRCFSSGVCIFCLDH